MKLVLCIHGEGYGDLTTGKVYEVVEEYKNGYEIIDNANDQFYYMQSLFMVILNQGGEII